MVTLLFIYNFNKSGDVFLLFRDIFPHITEMNETNIPKSFSLLQLITATYRVHRPAWHEVSSFLLSRKSVCPFSSIEISPTPKNLAAIRRYKNKSRVESKNFSWQWTGRSRFCNFYTNIIPNFKSFCFHNWYQDSNFYNS